MPTVACVTESCTEYGVPKPPSLNVEAPPALIVCGQCGGPVETTQEETDMATTSEPTPDEPTEPQPDVPVEPEPQPTEPEPAPPDEPAS